MTTALSKEPSPAEVLKFMFASSWRSVEFLHSRTSATYRLKHLCPSDSLGARF
jgi:hypothetical protein